MFSGCIVSVDHPLQLAESMSTATTCPLPKKYCKYHLFGRCKAAMCKHTHDISQAKVISCRKMNANNKDIVRCIKIINDNHHIEHINFGRNRLSKKHAHEIAQLLLCPKRKILSLCMDSTCIGRYGFIQIMNAAAKATDLTYLDVSDINFMPTDLSPKNNKSNRKNRCKPGNSAMNEYYRKEAITSILGLLSSARSNIEHLILGHNQLSYDECTAIAEIAALRGLTTLDLYGNKLNSEQLCVIHDRLYQNRVRVSIEGVDKIKCIPAVVSALIVEYTVHRDQCLYRCFKWKPR